MHSVYIHNNIIISTCSNFSNSTAEQWVNCYNEVCVCVHAQLCSILCDPMDCSPPGFSSLHGIFQARILEWVAIFFPTQGSNLSLGSPVLADRFFTSAPHGKPCSNFWNNAAVSMSKYSWIPQQRANCCCKDVFVCAQLSSTLFYHKDCGPPGSSSVHGIFQKRILKWVAISFSRDLPYPGMEPKSRWFPVLGDRFFTTAPPGKPCSNFWTVRKLLL